MAAWTHIAHSALSLPAATVTWTGISGSYDHLLIKISARSAESDLEDWIQATFNNDTASNYSQTYIYAASSTVYSSRGTSAFLDYWNCPSNTSLADTFGSTEAWIPNYSNTANFKQVFATSVFENNSTTNSEWKLKVGAGLWSATAAITEIDLVLGSGSDFMAYSTFDLYGILGA